MNKRKDFKESHMKISNTLAAVLVLACFISLKSQT